MDNYQLDRTFDTATKWVCTYFLDGYMHFLSFTSKKPGYKSARSYVEQVIIPYHFQDKEYNLNNLHIVLIPDTYIKYEDNIFYDAPKEDIGETND